MTTQITIDREMTIEDILNLFPHQAQALAQEITNAGLHCIGCGAAVWETLEAGMFTHGKTDEDIDTLVERLNTLLKKAPELVSDTISLTERAAAQYLKVLDSEDKQGWGIRIEEEMSGCNGFQHRLNYSENSTNDDMVFLSHEIEIHIEKKLYSKFEGSVIDYADGLQGAGFKIINPNIKTSCSCGSSYGY